MDQGKETEASLCPEKGATKEISLWPEKGATEEIALDRRTEERRMIYAEVVVREG
jgi:hypothetical protein